MKGPAAAIIATVVVAFLIIAYMTGFLGTIFKQGEQVVFTVDFTATPVLSSTDTFVVDFNSTVSGGIASFDYFWDFGDGTLGRGSDVQHTYTVIGPTTKASFAPAGGTYTVKLVVIDSVGVTRSVTKAVTVA
jgi:PKD repeat protein